jgi:hypothetical protein
MIKAVRGFTPLIVALLIALGAWFFYGGAKPVKRIDSKYTYTKSLAPLSRGSLDKMPKNLPTMFVFGSSPEVIAGESSMVGAKEVIRVVYTVTDTPFSFQEEAMDFIPRMLWKLSSEQTGNDVVRLSFIKSGAEVNLEILPHDRGSEVVVVYMRPINR